MKQLKQRVQGTIMLLLLATLSMYGQKNIEEIVKPYLEENLKQHNLSAEDVKEFSISSHHISKQSGIHHIYGNQQFNGLDIFQATFSLHLKNDNEVVVYHNDFISNLKNKLTNTAKNPSLSAIDALQSAAQYLNFQITNPATIIESKSEKQQVLDANSISRSPIQTELKYFKNENEKLVLVWELIIDDFKNNSLWNIKIDAQSGDLVSKKNMVLSCSTNNHDHSNEVSTDVSYGPKKESSRETQSNLAPFFTNQSYKVFEQPLVSPLYGDRTLVTNPYNSVASPDGWHFLYGFNQPYTKGNNVFAYSDTSGNNESDFTPTSTNLIFDYTIYPVQNGGDSSAAITNLFYWTNLCHDVWFHYGFDEASGNFQENNYGTQGYGNDSLKAEGQDPQEYCMAHFYPTPDGNRPRLQVGICNNRDSAFDNFAIAHEYGHGISTRLVGGANNINSLSNPEQMGEGWSDWFSLMMTMNANDNETKSRTAGTWLLNEDINGPGLREWPYSTDLSISPYTYNHLNILYNQNGFSQHDVGSVWASMLWEVTWELINAHGFDPDLYNGTGGNNIAMKLIIEGLILTPSSPGFVQARDAILQADTTFYNGENQCYIWRAFAKRGLGYSANQGSSNSTTDGVASFEEPECLNVCAFSSIEIINAGNFPECSELDLNGLYMGFSVSVSLTPPTNYDLNDFSEDMSAGNITLDIIDHDDPENNVFATYLLYANNTYNMDSNGNIIFHFPILNETFWGNNTEGNYDFKVNANLSTDDGIICVKNSRVQGISFDHCRDITCESNSIWIDSQIPDFSQLESPYEFDICGMFIVHPGYDPTEIQLEINDIENPESSFTLTIDNPQIHGSVPNFNAGQFGMFCFTLSISDFPNLDNNFNMSVNLITEHRNNECLVDSSIYPFSIEGFGSNDCTLITDYKIEDNNSLIWDGTAEKYTLLIQTDKSCCKSSKITEDEIIEFEIEDNSFNLNEIQDKLGRCIKFKIKSNCGDDTPWCCAAYDKGSKRWKLPKGNCLASNKIVKNSISVYPNPANDFINISSEKVNISLIEINDIYGKRVQTFENLNTRDYQINIDRLSRGYYVIKITLDDGTSQLKNVILN